MSSTQRPPQSKCSALGPGDIMSREVHMSTVKPIAALLPARPAISVWDLDLDGIWRLFDRLVSERPAVYAAPTSPA